MAIGGYSGYRWLQGVIGGYRWLLVFWVVIAGYSCLKMFIGGYRWFYIGYRWL